VKIRHVVPKIWSQPVQYTHRQINRETCLIQYFRSPIGVGLPTIGTENTGRIKLRARCVESRRGWVWGGVSPSPVGRGCAPPQKIFSNFCLEIACYGAFWKQFLRLDSSLFTSVSDSLSCETITRPIFISHQSSWSRKHQAQCTKGGDLDGLCATIQQNVFRILGS